MVSRLMTSFILLLSCSILHCLLVVGHGLNACVTFFAYEIIIIHVIASKIRLAFVFICRHITQVFRF